MSGTVLIVDDCAARRIALRARLYGARYEVAEARSIDAALCELRRAPAPAIILVAASLCRAGGRAPLAAIRAQPGRDAIPLIVFAAEARAETALATLAAGADDVLARDVEGGELLARVRSHLRRAAQEADGRLDGANAARNEDGLDEEGFTTDLTADLTTDSLTAEGLAEDGAPFLASARAMIVCSAPGRAARWRSALAPHLRGWRIELRAPWEALAQTGAGETDVYLLETSAEDPAVGLLLMSDMKSRAHSRHASFCMVAGGPTAGAAALALDLGADEVLTAEQFSDPTGAAEAALRLRLQIARKRRRDRRRDDLAQGLRMAFLDPLTGLGNRRRADAHLPRVAALARDRRRLLALMILDLDHFKAVNDRWGHLAGDSVLAEAARRLRLSLPAGALAARIGGEEFLLATDVEDRAEALGLAEGVRARLSEAAMALPGGRGEIRVTASVGVTCAAPSDGPVTVKALLEQADQALLQAKAAGRDATRLYAAASPHPSRQFRPPPLAARRT